MRTRALAAAAVIVSLLTPTETFAWGAVGHRLISRRVVDALPAELKPLFTPNIEEFVLRSNDPDLWRLMFADAETPNHQIDFGVDDYGAFPFVALPREYGAAVEKFGVATVHRHGTLPWRIEEVFGILRRTFEGFPRNQLYAEGNTIFYAAALSHYVGDATQPFHVHNNFDGQFTGQNGIHGRFESELIEKFDKRLEIKSGALKPITSPRDFAFEIALDGYQQVPKILQADKESIAGKDTYDDAYFEAFFSKVKPVLDRQLSVAVTDIASIIVAAWQQAGRPAIQVQQPRPINKVRRPAAAQ
jgi:hypothetical protein